MQAFALPPVPVEVTWRTLFFGKLAEYRRRGWLRLAVAATLFTSAATISRGEALDPARDLPVAIEFFVALSLFRFALSALISRVQLKAARKLPITRGTIAVSSEDIRLQPAGGAPLILQWKQVLDVGRNGERMLLPIPPYQLWVFLNHTPADRAKIRARFLSRSLNS